MEALETSLARTVGQFQALIHPLKASLRPEKICQMPIETGSAYGDLTGRFGRFPVETNLEVVEHVYAPRDYARYLFALLAPRGTAIISSTHHRHQKNLDMAVSGRMDAHFTALWDHDHIKFWSIRTLATLLEEARLRYIRFLRLGRTPTLVKSIIAIARHPA